VRAAVTRFPTRLSSLNGLTLTGVAGALARMRADVHLKRAILNDSAKGPPSPEQLARIPDNLERAGFDPAKAYDDVADLLARYGSSVPSTRLGAYSVVQLAIWNHHLQRAGR